MDINILGFVPIASITVICFLAAQGVKITKLDVKWLPVICGVLGGVLGAAGMFIIEGYPANDILNAVALGIVSGLASTGAHQIFKQLTEI